MKEISKERYVVTKRHQGLPYNHIYVKPETKTSDTGETWKHVITFEDPLLAKHYAKKEDALYAADFLSRKMATETSNVFGVARITYSLEVIKEATVGVGKTHE